MCESLKFCLSIHHLICFHLLLIMNKAAINIHIQIFLWTYFFVSLGSIPRNGIAGSYGNWMFQLFEELPGCFPKWLYHFIFPPTVYEGSDSCTSFRLIIWFFFFFFFGDSHPGGVKWYLVFWICISLMTNDVDHLFMCFLPFIYLLRNVISDSLPILRLGYLSFYCWLVRVLYMLYIQLSFQICDLQNLSRTLVIYLIGKHRFLKFW